MGPADWLALRPVVDAYASGRISWQELVGLVRRWLGGARDLAASLPMTPQQRALLFVRTHPGCTSRELAEALCVASASPWIAYLRDAGQVRTARSGGRVRIWLVEGPGVSRAPRAGEALSPTAALAGSRRRPPRG